MKKAKKPKSRSRSNQKSLKKSGQTRKEEKRNLKSENAAAEQEAIFTSIGDHVMGLVVVDKAGEIIRVNKAFESLTDWKGEEVVGKLLIKVVPREDENGNRVPFKERILSKILSGKILVSTAIVAAGGGIEKIPIFYYIRKDQSKFPVSSIISPILFKGKITGAVEVFYDITKEKELERIRTDFLSLASHQLRTPLSVTKWLLETMYKEVVGDMTKKQKEYLDSIYKNNEQMIKLVSDILNTLRLESEAPPAKKEKIAVSSLFKDVLTKMAATAEERKIVLRGPLNHRMLNVEVSSETLKTILGCFLSNAINYSMPGQKVILGIKEKSGTIIFSVRDFGIGIPQKERKRIFERFYRASNAKVLRPTGTGLSLNIAKMLAEKINAEISFESEENKGSTFYLKISKGRVRI